MQGVGMVPALSRGRVGYSLPCTAPPSELGSGMVSRSYANLPVPSQRFTSVPLYCNQAEGLILPAHPFQGERTARWQRHWIGARENSAQLLALPQIPCLTLGKSLHLTVPQVPSVIWGSNTPPPSLRLPSWFRG